MVLTKHKLTFFSFFSKSLYTILISDIPFKNVILEIRVRSSFNLDHLTFCNSLHVLLPLLLFYTIRTTIKIAALQCNVLTLQILNPSLTIYFSPKALLWIVWEPVEFYGQAFIFTPIEDPTNWWQFRDRVFWSPLKLYIIRRLILSGCT